MGCKNETKCPDSNIVGQRAATDLCPKYRKLVRKKKQKGAIKKQVEVEEKEENKTGHDEMKEIRILSKERGQETGR